MAKILIMDDETPIRNILYNLLKPLGHTVIPSQSGLNAVELAKAENPDIAILDMRVPDMDGIEVMFEIKKFNTDIKCIMLSSFGDIEKASYAVKKGAFDYISKPFKIDEALKAVNRALNIRDADYKGPIDGELTDNIPHMTQQSAPGRSEIVIEKRRLMIVPILGMLAIGAVSLLAYNHFAMPRAKIYKLPYVNPVGVSAAGSSLWVSEPALGNIYEHKTDKKLSMVSVYKTQNRQPTGLACGGQFIWSSNPALKKIYKHRRDNALTPEMEATFSEESPYALFVDEDFLWSVDKSAGKIYKHILDQKLSVVAVYSSPCALPTGIFKSGNYMFISSLSGAGLTRVSADDFNGQKKFVIKEMKNNKYKISGMTGDFKTLTACAESGGRIFVLPVGLLEEIK